LYEALREKQQGIFREPFFWSTVLAGKGLADLPVPRTPAVLVTDRDKTRGI
jgi:hypothetical protein